MRMIWRSKSSQGQTGMVLAFPDAASRPQRPAISADERKGVILLFTGIRYERFDTDTTPPAATSRRRRS